MSKSITKETINAIDKYLKDNFYKRNILEKILGLNPSSISSIFKYQRRLKLEEYLLIVKHFKLPFEYFLCNNQFGHPTKDKAHNEI